MRGKRIMFFSLLEDLEPVLRNVEQAYPIKYYKFGMFDSNETPTFNSIFDVPDLGYTKFEEMVAADSYLIIPSGIKLNIREIPQRKGETKFTVDQLINKQSVVITVAGIYTGKENVLIAGSFDTPYSEEFPQEIFNFFSKQVKKRFKRIAEFYVSPLAEERLKKGWRLVTSELSPPEYDLKLPP